MKDDSSPIEVVVSFDDDTAVTYNHLLQDAANINNPFALFYSTNDKHQRDVSLDTVVKLDDNNSSSMLMM